MIFYKRYPGDYQRDTGALSMIEDGAYMRMLDATYARERALPADKNRLYALVNAITDQEKEAVEYVLVEFWQKTEEGWINPRAQKEIKTAQERAVTNKYIAKEREARRKEENRDTKPTRKEHESFNDSSPNRATKLQPIHSHSHSQKPESEPKPERIPAPRSTSVATDDRVPKEFLRIPLVGKEGKEHIVTEDDITEYTEAYPAVDVRQQLREIRQWNLNNPSNRKTPGGIRHHIGFWLADKQNKAGSARMGGKHGPKTLDQTKQEMEEQWQRLEDLEKTSPS